MGSIKEQVDVLDAGKMCKRKYLSEFEKVQIVMRGLGESISYSAAVLGCSWFSVTKGSRTCATYLSSVADNTNPSWFPDGCGLFQQDNLPLPQRKNSSGMVWGTQQRGCLLDVNPVEHHWDVLDKQVQSMEATPHNLEDLKDLGAKHTFRGVVEYMSWQLRAVLVAKRRSTQY